MSSPVSPEHAYRHKWIVWWLTQYERVTPGCVGGDNGTWRMPESAPQPDAFLRILHGGQSVETEQWFTGAPELAVEVCLTSTKLDLGPKLRLYEKAGVREYITIEVPEKRIVWRMLKAGAYVAQELPADGIFRSRIFPGLWLDVAAFWADDDAKMQAALDAGLATEEHQRFVKRLANKE